MLGDPNTSSPANINASVEFQNDKVCPKYIPSLFFCARLLWLIISPRHMQVWSPVLCLHRSIHFTPGRLQEASAAARTKEPRRVVNTGLCGSVPGSLECLYLAVWDDEWQVRVVLALYDMWIVGLCYKAEAVSYLVHLQLIVGRYVCRIIYI
jgi:hypothetical protein